MIFSFVKKQSIIAVTRIPLLVLLERRIDHGKWPKGAEYGLRISSEFTMSILSDVHYLDIYEINSALNNSSYVIVSSIVLQISITQMVSALGIGR